MLKARLLESKVISKSLGEVKPKVLKRIAKIGQGNRQP